MPIGSNTNIRYPASQGDFNVSFASTQMLRDFMLGKNLDGSYLNRGNPIPPNGDQQPGSIVISDLPMRPVPEVPFPEDITGVDGVPFDETLFLTNKFGPSTGYGDPLGIENIIISEGAQLEYVAPQTLSPQAFVPQIGTHTNVLYTSIEVLSEVNSVNGVISTVNSKILDASILIKSSFPYLKDNLAFNQAQFLFDISDSGSANINITSPPGELVGEKDTYLSRLEGAYTPESDIPGIFFKQVSPPSINSLIENQIDQNTVTGQITALLNSFVTALNVGTQLPNTPTTLPVSSDVFIQYLGEEQRSYLFESLTYNIFRPDYTQVSNTGLVQSPTPYYYLGSRDNDPNNWQSPFDAIPLDKFDRSKKALVYGPSEVAKSFETVDGRSLWTWYKIGPQGEAHIDGGGLEGGFTWFGNKSLADTTAPPTFYSTRSSFIPLKRGTILDETQRLIDSAPGFGKARRQHAGHAIDQTSKIFHDGYRTISKGSRVTNWSGPGDVAWNCTEYCRIWTKDRPFNTYMNLQKVDGLQWDTGKNSVIDNTFNLNIAPTYGDNSTTMPTGESVKKYMFSIENLAWRNQPELQDLPPCEKGPNGGRIMWFPPYDLQTTDTSAADWNSTKFIGRTEPIYTYNSTDRIGTLAFKIVVDHPSILNAIIQTETPFLFDRSADVLIESFLAGCKKYDLYELAKKFPNVPMSTANQVQQALTDVTNQYNTDPTTTIANNNQEEEIIVGSLEEGEEIIVGNTENADSNATTIENVEQGTPDNQSEPISSSSEVETNIKTIIRKVMLNEAFYFQALKESDPLVYNSLRQTLKFFNPTFHSMTPEGLNSRLTFLNQCVRPGRTIPTVTADGKQQLDVDNTAFGPPPVCVLRVGDFYHSKIIIDSVSLSYDENLLDINPEGIGLQPMIASVQLNFKFIGGQGLKEPVSRLQNALSFNFFGNTEVYDDRSISTISPPEPEVVTTEVPSELEANNSNNTSTNNTSNNTNANDGESSGTFEQSASTGPNGETTTLGPVSTPIWALNTQTNSYIYQPGNISGIQEPGNNTAGETNVIADANTNTEIPADIT